MPHHVVVDGSNLATEGRSMPSLKQLNEAVLAYMAEHPTALITVVVDATFGHRIDAKEAPEFDEAIANNELVAPPAGAVGRGDAFVLSIANKVNATILSNDSYQEFHGQYAWLFDEGRLVGGKPVPHIGWVFVPRLPVRGPLSRKSMSDAKRKGGRGKAQEKVDETVRVGSPEASKPMPIPKTPPPGAAGARGRGRGKAAAEHEAPEPVAAPTPALVAAEAASPKGPTVNDLLSFLTFVEHHPPGTSVNAVVDHYSSHGAYVRVGDVMGYVPLRLMAEPAPRSAREFMKIGESITLVVDSFVAGKRSIDLAVPGVGSVKPIVAPATPEPAKPRRGGSKKAASPAEAAAVGAAPEATRPKRGGRTAVAESAPVAEAAPARKRAARTATPPAAAPSAKKNQPAKQVAETAPAAVAKKSTAKKSAPAKKASAKAGAVKKAPSSTAPPDARRRRGAASA